MAPVVVVPPEVESLLDPERDNVTPEERGEAALVAGLLGADSQADRLRALTRHPHPSVRRQALLGLGLLGASGAPATLSRVFDEADPRTPDRIAAATGLGLLPGDRHLAPLLDRYLAQLRSANPRRERDTVAALLVGWTLRPKPAYVGVLEDLCDDPSFRDPQLGAAALLALDALPDGLRDVDWRAWLGDSEPSRVRTALRLIAARRPDLDAATTQELKQLVRRARPRAVRAEALRTAQALRWPIALPAARAALHSEDRELCVAGIAAATGLGGGSLRTAAAERLAFTTDHELLTEALAVWRGPLKDCLRDRIDAELSALEGSRWPARLRILAAAVRLRDRVDSDTAHHRAEGVLLDMLHGVADPELSALAAAALPARLRQGPDAEDRSGDTFAKWFEPTAVEDLPRLPARFVALSRCGDPRAESYLRAGLADARLSSTERVALLRAWRHLLIPSLAPATRASAPPSLRSLLLE